MDRKILSCCALLAASAGFAFSANANAPTADDGKALAARHYASLPLAFEPNQGQADASVRFVARGAGYGLGLGADGEAIIGLQASAAPVAGAHEQRVTGSVVRQRLVGGNAAAPVSGESPLPGSSSYLIGASADQWHSGIAQYSRVRRSGVYPGIDLVYYGNQSQLEYDFDVAPGADAGRIVMQFDGAQKLALDANGNLLVRTAQGQLTQHRPVVYQEVDGRRVAVEGDYRLIGRDRVAFSVAAYDHSRALVIDPILTLNLYVPGVNREVENAVAVDSAGSAYVAGYSTPMNWLRNLPVVGSLLRYDAFVVKLNPAGNAISYLTYFGGSGDDEAMAIAVDAAGNAYVTGYTNSNDFPVVNPAQGAKQGYDDAFVVKLQADGKGLVYSTFLGGTANDVGTAIAVDKAGNAYVGGYTASLFFPTTAHVPQATFGGGNGYDGFVTKLNAAGDTLVYSTFLGGNDNDSVNAIAVDSAGSAYVAGSTVSANFPVHNAFQPKLSPPFVESVNYSYQYADGFVAKISPGGTGLVYSTYLGGVQGDQVNAIAVDALGNAYVTGVTNSPDFPLHAPLPSGSNSGPGFITELSSAGNALVFSSFLDGSASGLALDAAGDIFVAGYTYSQNFHTRLPYQPANSGGADAFLVKIGPHGSGLVFGTYLGASAYDSASAVAVDEAGNAYLAGNSSSKNFPATKPVQGASYGHGDGFVSKFSGNGQTLTYSTYLGETDVYAGLTASGGKGVAISVPIHGIIGCTLRALPDGVVFPIEILYPTHAPCGQPQPAP